TPGCAAAAARIFFKPLRLPPLNGLCSMPIRIGDLNAKEFNFYPGTRCYFFPTDEYGTTVG
ncbi:MAG: hypothetical protein R3274_08275, partial [Desulfobacterales bacterium]|nr:hypothetical protein [Desulfobacterales bacterium]